jgi:hypothetical protein
MRLDRMSPPVCRADLHGATYSCVAMAFASTGTMASTQDPVISDATICTFAPSLSTIRTSFIREARCIHAEAFLDRLFVAGNVDR